MVANIDENFYDRADAVINLVNGQLAGVSRGKVSASCMYATARFNAWIAACRHGTAEDMEAAKQEIIEYFVEQYRAMLEENVDDYIENFDRHVRSLRD